MADKDVQLTDDDLRALTMGGNHSETHLPPTNDSNGSPLPSHPILIFRMIIGNGVLLIFGDTGSGKSKTVLTLVLDALVEAEKVIYYDLEGNIHGKVLDKLVSQGCDYRRVKRLDEVYKRIKTDKADLLVIDSATLQITGRWFGERVDERGRTLQEVQYLYQKVNDWCLEQQQGRKPRMALITAQPVSEFGGRGLDPMGDKARFFTKEEYYIQFEKDANGITVKRRDLVVFKSRSFEEGTLICPLKTTREGVIFGEWGDEIKGFLTDGL